MGRMMLDDACAHASCLSSAKGAAKCVSFEWCQQEFTQFVKSWRKTGMQSVISYCSGHGSAAIMSFKECDSAITVVQG